MWRYNRDVPALSTNPPQPAQITLKNVVIDDWFFGVSAVSADGYESPVVFPGDAGKFEPDPVQR